MVIALIIVLVFGGAVFLAVSGLLSLHNRLSSTRAAAQLALNRLESECARRGELLGRLMESVRVFMHPQREVLEAVLLRRNAVSRAMGAALARPSEALAFEQWYGMEQELRAAFERFQAVAADYSEFRSARHIAQVGGELQAVWERVDLFERAYNESSAEFNRLWNGVVCGLVARFLGYEAVPVLEAVKREPPAPVLPQQEREPSVMIAEVGEDAADSQENGSGGGRVFYG